METRIRQASLADKDAIHNFLESVYADYGSALQQKIIKRWTWQYLDNPCIDGNNDNLQILVVQKEDQIVGQGCGTHASIKVDGQLHTAFWGTDFIVTPVCRGEGIGKKIMQIEVNDWKFMMGVNMPPVTRGIAAKIGFKELGAVPLYRRPVRFDNILMYHYLMKATRSKPGIKRIAKTLWNTLFLGKLAAAVTYIILGLRNLVERQPKKEFQTDIQEVKAFDENINRLWSLTNHQYKVIAKRDKDFLNWRYSPDNMLEYSKFIATRNGEVKGYVVLRKEDPSERNFGIIADVYAARDDRMTIEDLLRHAVHFFGKDVVAIECAASVAEYQEALKKFGFLKMESAVPMYYCEDSSVAAKLNDLKNECFFTKGDHDWDQYWPVRGV